jgi:phospholipid N-methyltransferase
MMFLSQTFKSSAYSGLTLPSSKKLVDLMASKTKLEKAEVVVELGPGNRNFTQEIVSRLNENSKYLAIEISDSLVYSFSKKFPELKICHDSAENISKCLKENGLSGCDRVISSLPWTAFEANFQRKLVERIHQVLDSNGMFVIFSYCSLDLIEEGRSFKKMLKKFFNKVTETKIKQSIPSVFVCICKK